MCMCYFSLFNSLLHPSLHTTILSISHLIHLFIPYIYQAKLGLLLCLSLFGKVYITHIPHCIWIPSNIYYINIIIFPCFDFESYTLLFLSYK